MNKKFLSMAVALALTTGVAVTGFVQATPIGGNSVTVTSVTPGNTTTKLGKTEDAAHSSGDTGVSILGVRRDTQAAGSGTTGDYETINLNALGAVYTQLTGNTTGGLSIFRNIDVDESPTGQSAKDAAGTLYTCTVVNDTAATEEYLKIYDATAAGTTVGTTTPVMTIPLPTGKSIHHFNFGNGIGIAFANGITFAATTALADNDTGAPAANAVQVNCAYK